MTTRDNNDTVTQLLAALALVGGQCGHPAMVSDALALPAPDASHNLESRDYFASGRMLSGCSGVPPPAAPLYVTPTPAIGHWQGQTQSIRTGRGSICGTTRGPPTWRLMSSIWTSPAQDLVARFDFVFLVTNKSFCGWERVQPALVPRETLCPYVWKCWSRINHQEDRQTPSKILYDMCCFLHANWATSSFVSKIEGNLRVSQSLSDGSALPLFTRMMGVACCTSQTNTTCNLKSVRASGSYSRCLLAPTPASCGASHSCNLQIISRFATRTAFGCDHVQNNTT